VVGGRPLTVIVTGPSAAAGAAALVEDEQAAADSPRAATNSSPAARPNGDRFIRQHLPGSTASIVWCADHTNSPLIDARTRLRCEITKATRAGTARVASGGVAGAGHACVNARHACANARHAYLDARHAGF